MHFIKIRLKPNNEQSYNRRQIKKVPVPTLLFIRTMGKRVPSTEEEKSEKNVLARKKRDVSFCKRRKTVFTKASKLCFEHGTQIAVLVLSPSGKPYAFGHTSVEAVLNQYFNVQQEETKQLSASVIHEERNMVECMKERIENELGACQTVQDFALLRERLRDLYEKTNERLNNSSCEEDHIMHRMRSSSGTNMVSPNYLQEPAPCPQSNLPTHGLRLNGGLSSGRGNYVVVDDDREYHGKNNNGHHGSLWGAEYAENIMPDYLSQRSSSNTFSPNFFNHPPYPMPDFSTHVVSVNEHLSCSDGNNVRGGYAYDNNVYGCEEYSWGTQYVENVGRGNDVTRYSTGASMASYLSGNLSSDNTSLFVKPLCPLPNISTPVSSPDRHSSSTSDQAQGRDVTYGEGCYEVLRNIDLGLPFEAPICLSGIPSSNKTIDSPRPLPNISTAIPSRDCSDDHAYAEDMSGEGSYNVLQNMELGQDSDNVDNQFDEATINLSGSSSLNNPLLMDSSCPLPNTSPSLDSHLRCTEDQAWGGDISSWEGSYEVLGNIGLGQDDPDYDNFFGSTIYLPGHSCSNPPSPDSLFPTCPSPKVFDNHEDLTYGSVDVSAPGAMVSNLPVVPSLVHHRIQ